MCCVSTLGVGTRVAYNSRISSKSARGSVHGNEVGFAWCASVAREVLDCRTLHFWITWDSFEDGPFTFFNPFTPDSAKSETDQFTKITNWVKLKNKQHHSKILLNSFPMNGPPKGLVH